MDAKQLLSLGIGSDQDESQSDSQSNSVVPRSLRVAIDSVPEIRQASSRFPRGIVIKGASPILRQPVHVALPNNYPVTLFTEKFLPSICNPKQSIAQKPGDVVIIPKDTIVTFDGQTMTLVASAPPHTDNGYVRILSNQLYIGDRPIRFTACPGKAPVGTQFKLKAACISDTEDTASLIASLKNDLGMQTGSVIDKRAA